MTNLISILGGLWLVGVVLMFTELARAYAMRHGSDEAQGYRRARQTSADIHRHAQQQQGEDRKKPLLKLPGRERSRQVQLKDAA